MQAKSFGKIAVPTPGTPVRLTMDTTLRVARLRFAAVIGETGRVFLGVAAMNKANGTWDCWASNRSNLRKRGQPRWAGT